MEFELKKIKEIAAVVKKKTAVPAYTFTICPDKTPCIFDSKFGGLPYWDKSKTYPSDANGNPMILLAQINFDQIHPDAPLPGHGMLQFFIGTNAFFGLDYKRRNVQDTFRVVYHETLDTSISRKDIEKMNLLDSTKEEWKNFTPVNGEWAVKCEKQTSSMDVYHKHFDQVFWSVAKEFCSAEEEEYLRNVELEDDEVWEMLEEEINDSSGGHQMLGYPAFVQDDPRTPRNIYNKYDTLLFQMDSDFGPQYEYVLWGDSGIGNFFINHEALERKDFSDVFYDWDCC